MANKNSTKIINELAKEFKFDVCKGEMKWMEETFERRKSPLNLWSETKSAIVLGLNYGPESDPLEKNNNKSF